MSAPGDRVDLWLIRTDVAGPPGAVESVLDRPERERADALLSAEDRYRFVVAHARLRFIVGAHLGVPPAELRWRPGPQGKPALTGSSLQTSLSRSGPFALLAITAHRSLGVDLQEVGGHADVRRLAERFYPPNEAAAVLAAASAEECAHRFTRLWTRKEACVKVAGGRLVAGLQVAAGPAASNLPADGLVATGTRSLPGPFRVCDTAAPPGFCASVALAGTQPFSLVVREAGPHLAGQVPAR